MPSRSRSTRSWRWRARRRRAGRKRLVVTGCLSQRYDAELRREIPEIDATLGTGQVEDILRAVTGESTITDADQLPAWVYDHTAPRVLSTPPYMAYVKISEGCDYTCCFCIIPTLRGKHRSRQRGRHRGRGARPRRPRRAARSCWSRRTRRATASTSGCATACARCCGGSAGSTASAGSASCTPIPRR